MVAATSPDHRTASGIVAVCAALMTVGIVMIASASANLDQPLLRQAPSSLLQTTFGRQALFASIAFCLMIVFVLLGPRLWTVPPNAWVVFAAVLTFVATGALVAVLIPGIGAEVNGARRWMRLGPDSMGLRFQPSELAKPALVIALAILLSRPRDRVRSFRQGVIPAALLIGLLGGLVGVEDFGTAVLLLAVGGIMMFVGGVRFGHLLLLAGPAAAALIYLVRAAPYRMERLTAFRNIWDDPLGAGYHPIQSLVTIASGGWFGRGLGNGIQKHGYLPESRTDFIFSIICEETGILGGVAVIGLFGLFVWLGARAMRQAPHPAAGLVAFGVTATVALQAAMNIAVVTVCVPTKGIALPFVSAGGSGIIFLGVAAGLMASVAAAGQQQTAPRDVAEIRPKPAIPRAG